jgi:hypothetical protein
MSAKVAPLEVATTSSSGGAAEQTTPDEFAGLGAVETKKLAKARAREVKAEINTWCAAFEER